VAVVDRDDLEDERLTTASVLGDPVDPDDERAL
jgi:hypothetical protein